jgi:hypothetical protein
LKKGVTRQRFPAVEETREELLNFVDVHAGTDLRWRGNGILWGQVRF